MTRATVHVHPLTSDNLRDDECGLTIREYFAAQALVGLLSFASGESPQFTPEDAARFAVELADALVVALERPRSAAGAGSH